MSQLSNDRQYWLDALVRISRPVLTAFAEKRLSRDMPIGGLSDEREGRRKFASLEALGRTLTGMAPWLECLDLDPGEDQLREELCILARNAIDAGTDPDSPDFGNFGEDHQPIVDAAFLAQAVLRAPHQLWEKLDPRIRRNLVRGLQTTRSRKPFFCNWLLFSAMIEACLFMMGEAWDRMRVDYAIKQHEQWYLGDGVYGDGPEFHWDYYNSFVIQPMLVDILDSVGMESPDWHSLKPAVLGRAARYAEILERLIAWDGTFPPIGRSLAYRFGAFHHLAQTALQKRLPATLVPGQVRAALTAVIRRVLEAPGTFDRQGWLRIGICGDQNDMGESYISTASLYLCTTVFLPLGLPPRDPFWSDPPQDWTAKRIWSGENMLCDHALE